MDIEKKIELISKAPTIEIVTEQEIKQLVETNNKPVSYWGIAPTGPPHIGYYKAIAKQIDLVNAGFKHKLLIADVHAYLDDRKSPWEERLERAKVYEKCLRLIGLDKNVEYVLGSNFQLTKEYQMETLKAVAFVTAKRATRAASEVCRMQNPKVSSLVYPVMQTLDCWALKVDVAISGTDNRHVYMLSRELLPKLGHKKPSIVFNRLGVSMSGGAKMSASEKGGRIEFYASEEKIEKIVKSAYCEEGKVEGNPVLDYCQFFVFPRVKNFVIKRDKKYGGDLSFNSYNELEKQFKAKKVHPLDLKNATAKHMIEILEPIRKYFAKNIELLETFNR